MTVSRLLAHLMRVPTDRPFLASDACVPGPKLRAMADYGWVKKTARDKTRSCRWFWEMTEEGKRLVEKYK